MIIGGVICLALSAVALYFFFDARGTLQAAQKSETLTCGEIDELSQAAAEAVGAGSFSHACEVAGVAVGAEHGPLHAPESGVECIWHRSTVTEHYWDWERDSDGDRRRVRKERQLSSHASETAFIVDDGTGKIPVDPRGADIDGEEKVVDRMEDADDGRSGGGSGFASLVANLGQSLMGGDSTIALEYEEWVIRSGARVYALGEVRDDGGRVRLAKPAKGKMIISTRSEEEVTGSARKTMTLAAVGAGVLDLAGIGLIVAGLLA
ncbi:MAG TPA: GIDE domain-containing protein [Solirubrobacteraceae bacterium]|jgi:hypothetical protein